MRKCFFVVVVVLCAMRLQAQSSFFIQPSAGVGLSNAVYQYQHDAAQFVLKSLIGDDVQLEIGYRLKRWRFAIGISALTTGFKYRAIPGPPTEYHTYYYHKVFPVTVSYVFPIAKQWALVPAAGVVYALNTREDATLLGTGTPVPDSYFKQNFYASSYYARASLHLEYTLTNKVHVFAGPSASIMITNMSRDYMYGNFVTMRSNAYLMEGGVVWTVLKLKKKGAGQAVTTSKL